MTTIFKLNQYREAAEILKKHGDAYPEDGPVELPADILDRVAADLKHVPVELLYDLDAKPYAYLSHRDAEQIQWFSRRFRNSGGWKKLYPEGN